MVIMMMVTMLVHCLPPQDSTEVPTLPASQSAAHLLPCEGRSWRHDLLVLQMPSFDLCRKRKQHVHFVPILGC